MKFEDTKEYIVSFYRNSDRPTFWFSLIILSQLLAFIPSFPSMIIYAVFFVYACYIIHYPKEYYYRPLLAFIIYIPIQLLILEPNEMFRSWERFIFFTLLLICVSPLIVGINAINNRKTIFQISLVVCAIIGVGSFFARFLGVNYGAPNRTDYILAVGTFGGLTSHSMLLGPIAGVGAIFCCWLGYLRKSRLYWVMAVLSVFSVMFSASRSSLIATIAAITILIYKLSQSATTFTKIIAGIVLMMSISFPFWGRALDSIIKKNELNIAAGSASSSRDALWEARVLEFKSEPMLGVGFDAINLDISRSTGGYDDRTGMVESGSSWLIILSMTGIIGAILIIPILVDAYKIVYQSPNINAALICSILTLFYIHMIAEGYIFYGGSMLAFLLWNTVGVACDLKQLYE